MEEVVNMKLEYKVFDGGTVKEMLVKCLSEGFRPLNVKEAYDWKKKSNFSGWVDTSTFYKKGVIKDITLKQLKSCKGKYEKFGRPLVVGDCNDGGDLSGSSLFNISGRFVGVKKKIRK